MGPVQGKYGVSRGCLGPESMALGDVQEKSCHAGFAEVPVNCIYVARPLGGYTK